jgi:hypothetical protein
MANVGFTPRDNKGIIIPFKPLFVGGSDFLMANFCHFSKDIFKTNYVANSLFILKKTSKNLLNYFCQKSQKLPTK